MQKQGLAPSQLLCHCWLEGWATRTCQEHVVTYSGMRRSSLREQTFFPAHMVLNTSALCHLTCWAWLAPRAFLQRITVVSQLPTGRSPASCLSCPNIRAKKCTLHKNRGVWGVSLCLSCKALPVCFSLVRSTGDHCPTMPVSFYLIMLSLMLHI